MKTIMFAIMAVLIFGVAAAPVFSNGVVFAQTQDPEKTEKEKKEQRSDESKQQKAQQAANTEERKDTSKERKEISKEKHAEDSKAKQEKRDKRTAAQELQDQRRAELKAKNQALMDRLATKEKASEKRMQERIDNMQERSPMNDAMDRLNESNSKCGAGTSFDSEINSCVLDGIDSSDVKDNTQFIVDSDELETSGTYFDKLRNIISEQKRQQDVLFKQVNILLELVDSMCEDRVLVASVSDGNLRCIDSDRAFNLHSRGIVTLVE